MAREMKDSGVAWVSSIPLSWDVQRGKNILTLLNRPVTEDDGVITCFRDGEVTLRSKRREEGFTMSDKEIGYQGIEAGDLVVHGMDGFAGAIGISDSRGKGTPVLNVMDSSQNKRFLMYFLRCAAQCGLFLSLSTGIRVRSCDTNWNKLKNVLFILPPNSEQQRIVSFLDSECSHIDTAIEQTRASIEEYKKLKQTVITQAVTKGIRPDRPMKDSGIDWIGEIPKEWEPTKFKYLAMVKSNLVEPDNYGDYPQVSPENIEKDSGRLLSCKTVSEVGVISGNHLFFKGQILYSKIRPKLNKITIAPFDGLCSADMYPIETDQNTRFLVYAMLSDVLLSQVSMITEDRVKMPKINQDELGNTWFAKPSLEEQSEIVEYLDARCREIDYLTDKKKILLSNLESYKNSLIYEYVTGKKEVPA